MLMLPSIMWKMLHELLMQGYAWEITTPEGGSGLDELLSTRKSVLNGIP